MRASFFRSLSLTEDLDQPDRFAHYRPTRRATPIVAAVMQPRAATMVIAPYGSGKSLAAGVGALAVRGEAADRRTLQEILPRFGLVDRELAARTRERLEEGRRGKVVALSGHVPSPLAAIAQQLGLSKTPATLDGLSRALQDCGADHVAIIWDEFGRHLEGLVADGRSGDMDFVQRLAERTARASGPTFSFTLLLHQNLLAYASRLNETTRSEWRKIEGRFNVTRLIEDSQEIYHLIAEVVASLRPGKPRGKSIKDLTERVREARWFDGIEDIEAIERILHDVRPLSAGALQVLPTIVARVGQNERSLFSFLQEVDLGAPVGIEQIYATFSDAMRADVGIGGSYRRWVEAESARSRARDPLQRELIAAACLLQLGVNGERVRLPREVLELSVISGAHDGQEVRQAVDDLIASNLLLWRRHNDDVAVWHGADIDISSRLSEERERQAIDFNLQSFLQERFPAPNLRTPGHNARFGVNRYFRGHYAAANVIPTQPIDNDDCSIVYILARTPEEIDKARATARTANASGLILVVPHIPLDVESAALEIVAIESLRKDTEFVSSDPMVTTELDELQSVAFEQLANLLRPLVSAHGPAAGWWAQGTLLAVTNDRPGTMAASVLLDDWYALTPRIDNEQLMRDHASRTMQTSRVRLITAILERAERDRLGGDADDRGIEGSIYRTVFEKTGLHRNADLRFAKLGEIEHEGLAKVWSTIAEFFQKPTSGTPRPLTELIETLQNPPIGLPRAVTPLLVAAGYKQFARAVAIYRDGVYEPDLLGFQFDQMVMNPAPFTVGVEDFKLPLTHYLNELCYAFSHEKPGPEDELVRRAWDAIQRWRLTVPESARRTHKLDDDAKNLLAATSGRDPLKLVLQEIPRSFGAEGPDYKIIESVERARKAIDELKHIYAEEAVSEVRAAFHFAAHSGDDLLEAVSRWSNCFDHVALEQGHDLRISDKAVLSKAVETANGRFSPKSFAGALSSILLKCGLERWDDRSAGEFRRALREARERIEQGAMQSEVIGPALRPILTARLQALQAQLDSLDAHSAAVDTGKTPGGGR